MKIKVVLSRQTIELLWALGAHDRHYSGLGPDEAVAEIDEDIVSEAIDLFDDATFDEAVQRLAHVKIAASEDGETPGSEEESPAP